MTKTTVTNVLKKFCVQVDKTDIERMNAQGDATLAGAVYGIYKGGELVDTYTTDSQGRFTTDIMSAVMTGQSVRFLLPRGICWMKPCTR